MTKPRIYADFQNADAQGRIRLNTQGTLDDINELQLEMCDGLAVTLYTDDVNPAGAEDFMEVDGVVSLAEAEKCWVATIDWNAIHHTSELTIANRNGANTPISPIAADSNLTRR